MVPLTSLEIGWTKPSSVGCLPILSYTINKNGIDTEFDVSPTATTYTDLVVGKIGDKVTYKIKAVNFAGSGEYSEPVVITVGQVPSAPVDLAVLKIVSKTEIQITWEQGASISIVNPLTTSYKIFLDDGSGNGPQLYYDSAPRALANIYTLSNLVTGNSYDVTVKAVNEIGESTPSNPLTIHAGVVPSQI